MPVLADDSGLCVEALDGAPGLYSARYGSPELGDLGKARYLLSVLEDVPAPRVAWFHCSIAAVLPSGWLLPEAEHTADVRVETITDGWSVVWTQGKLYGEIGFEPAGSNGFGYDPVFLPRGWGGRTLAELSQEDKNRISHRSVALRTLLPLLVPLAGGAQ